MVNKVIGYRIDPRIHKELKHIAVDAETEVSDVAQTGLKLLITLLKNKELAKKTIELLQGIEPELAYSLQKLAEKVRYNAKH